jgi:integrase
MDRKETDMFLSKRPNGIYHIYYKKPNGKLTSISTKSKLKSEANKYLAKFSNELTKQEDTILKSILLKTFSIEFLKQSETVHTFWTNYTYKQTYKFFNNYFPNILISDLRASDISRYIEYRIKNSSIYQDVKKVKVPQKLPLFYSKRDFHELLNVIDSEDIKDLVIFAVNTGLRQMELIKLEWNQIKLDKNIVILDNQYHITKGKRVRTIPLNSKGLQILEKRFVNKIRNRVFTYRGNHLMQDFLSHKYAGYVEKAKLNTKLNFHSLRHTFASWLVQKGVSIYEVSKLLGHADIKTTQIYAHLRSDDLRNAVEMLD